VPVIPRLALTIGSLVGLLAVVLLMGRADSVHAQTFNPQLTVSVVDPQPEVPSDYTVEFNVEEGDVNFAGLVAFIDGDWGIVPGDQIPIGAVVGELTAQATLGLINGACNTVLTVDFTFLNSSIDITDTVSFEDTDPETDVEGYQIDDFSEDKDDSGLPDAFERYPDFINRVLDDEDGNPQQPIRRSAGITIVAGISVLLQFLIFEPGTFLNENIPNDESLGYPSVTLLQNIGDPDNVPSPGPITDFCTRLTSTNTSFGISKDNACTDDIPIDDLDPMCTTTGAIILEEGGTNPDDSGNKLFVNPTDGEYTFTIWGAGQRDADGDGYENGLDTCPFIANEGNPRVGGDGDFDSDGLDAACDPDDNEVNSDQDADGYLNRGDNCPQDPNGEDEDNQADEEPDGIGDACDPNANDGDAQGELILVETTQDIAIGTGAGEGGRPSEAACAPVKCFEPGVDRPGGGGGGGGGDNDNTTLIIIIVAVIAGVVIVGGGAFFMMRGRGGGGATPSV
jgi:hypothetical protein